MNGELPPEAAGALAAVLVVQLVVFLALYIYMAVCLMKLAEKTNTPNGWMAWVPILNVYLMLQIGGKPGWWLVLALIPLVNLIFIILMVITWMAIAKARNKPEWLGILMIVPLANLVVPGYLAFSE